MCRADGHGSIRVPRPLLRGRLSDRPASRGSAHCISFAVDLLEQRVLPDRVHIPPPGVDLLPGSEANSGTAAVSRAFRGGDESSGWPPGRWPPRNELARLASRRTEHCVRLDIVRADEELAVFDLVIDQGQRTLRGSGFAIAVRIKCAAVTRADKHLASAFPGDLAALMRASGREHAEGVRIVAVAQDPD